MMKHLVVVARRRMKPARRRFEVVIGVVLHQQALDFGNELTAGLLGERNLRQYRGLGCELRGEKKIQVAHANAEASRGAETKSLGCAELGRGGIAGLVRNRPKSLELDAGNSFKNSR